LHFDAIFFSFNTFFAVQVQDFGPVSVIMTDKQQTKEEYEQKKLMGCHRPDHDGNNGSDRVQQ
jgi:hypothetical protein